ELGEPATRGAFWYCGRYLPRSGVARRRTCLDVAEVRRHPRRCRMQRAASRRRAFRAPARRGTANRIESPENPWAERGRDSISALACAIVDRLRAGLPPRAPLRAPVILEPRSPLSIMQRHLAGFALAIALLVPGIAPADVKVPDGFVHELVATGFYEPNSMAFLPDWRLLVTEQRLGRIRLVVGGNVSSKDPIYTIPDLVSAGLEQGLQGIAVDPAWPQ